MDNSSSKYFDACSNSKEINEIYEAKENNQKNANKLDFNKDIENKNIYESPKKTSNNNLNIDTNFSTGLNNSIQNSKLEKNMMISTRDQTNSETGKNIRNLRIQKKINLYSMNSVKKNLMSPIEENIQFEFANINSNEKMEKKLNNINEITNNNNNNININIIINKEKKLQNDSELNSQNKKSSNNKPQKSRMKKMEIINTNINNAGSSLYSSIDDLSSSIFINKKKKTRKNKSINSINNKDSEISIETNNPNKIFQNSISDSLYHNNKYGVKKLNFGSFQNNSSLMINSITFQNIGKDILTVNDLKMKYNLRDIPVKRKEGFLYKNKYIYSLIELQIFNFGDCPIWVIKISHNGKYLAAGNKAGKIRIYELMGYDYDKYENSYNNKNIMNYLYLVNEKPIKELSEHKKDITDLCWSPFKYNLLLSSSVDNYVILWDISKNNNCLINKFKHDDYVTCVKFSPINENLFITGCFDKFIRMYKINNDNNAKNNNKKGKLAKVSTNSFGFFNIADKITSLSFYPNGTQIAIGTINGKIYVYDILANTGRYNHNFNCKNKYGKNSFGKKVTSITFLNKKNAIISSCDSCIRLISMHEGRNLSKYKGNVNENGMIRADFDFSNDIIISGSEDGYCYTWKILAEDTNYLKNYNYESFKPFERDVVECCIIVNEECFANYMKKVLNFTNKINILSIFINSTDNGKIEVLLNINEEIN